MKRISNWIMAFWLVLSGPKTVQIGYTCDTIRDSQGRLWVSRLAKNRLRIVK